MCCGGLESCSIPWTQHSVLAQQLDWISGIYSRKAVKFPISATTTLCIIFHAHPDKAVFWRVWPRTSRLRFTNQNIFFSLGFIIIYTRSTSEKWKFAVKMYLKHSCHQVTMAECQESCKCVLSSSPYNFILLNTRWWTKLQVDWGGGWWTGGSESNKNMLNASISIIN